MSRRRTQSQSGFTIVDVAMGATILVVGLIAMIQAITNGAEMLDTARKQLVAQQLVDYEIERLRMGAWSDVTNFSTGTTYTITIDNAGAALSGTTASKQHFALANYTSTSADDLTSLMSGARNFTMTVTASVERTEFYNFTYTVTWTGVTGRTHSWTHTAKYGRHGLQLSYQKA